MKLKVSLPGKALRLLLVVALISTSLPLTPGRARADDRLLQNPAVDAVNKDLRLMGLELDARNRELHQYPDQRVWFYGVKSAGHGLFGPPPDQLPLCAFLIEKNGELDHIQLLTLDRSAQGARLILEVTSAADPDHSVSFTIERGSAEGSSPGIFLAARERSTGERVDIGLVKADAEGHPYFAEIYARGYYDCIKNCINNWLSELGFWSAIGLVCCILAGGIVAIVGGAATAGAAIAAAVPAVKLCLEALAFAAGGTTVVGVAGCMVACIF